MTKISVVGSGVVGQTLADGFLKHGYEVMRASREPSKLADWKSTSGKGQTGTFAEAAKWGEMIVLAVKGSAAEEAVALCGDGLAGKVVVDTTNPIADLPPVNGVIQYFTGPNDSLMERLQRKAPQAHFVKAFSCVGNALMVNPELSGGKPSMFICGNHTGAKEQVRGVLDRFGWETEDLGMVEAARAIEPLCILWCIPGFLNKDWTHAYKVLRK